MFSQILLLDTKLYQLLNIKWPWMFRLQIVTNYKEVKLLFGIIMVAQTKIFISEKLGVTIYFKL